MIVQCENCETRFHVADARIPEKGARVRCSRCHHRFHITPSSGSSAAPAPEGDGSAAEEPAGAPVPAPAAREPGADDELDNPEFLFEDGGTSGQAAPAPRPTPRAARPAQPSAEPQIERLATRPPEPEPAPAPPVPLEERVVSTTGKTAQEMLDLGAPKLASNAKVEFGSGLKEDPPSEFFSEDEPPAAERERKAGAKAGPSLELDAGFGGSLGDDEETDPGWDALTRSEQPADVFAAGASFGLLKQGDAAAAPVSASGSAPLFAEEGEPANTRKRQAPAVSSFDPEARGSLARIVQVAAFFVGVALLGGAVRGLALQREVGESAPTAEQAAGWITSDVETFVARDSSGERVLVVRGNLFPDGAAPPPEVQVTLLEAGGQPVGEPRRAWLERLDDAEIAPDELGVRLASDAGELSGVGPKVTGFTALLPDPPASARRLQVTLTPGRVPARGTATANAPAPVPVRAPEPSPHAPAANTQLAKPQAPAPAPAQSGNAAGSDVVPAAPAPQ